MSILDDPVSRGVEHNGHALLAGLGIDDRFELEINAMPSGKAIGVTAR